jgi:hypothetical protein
MAKHTLDIIKFALVFLNLYKKENKNGFSYYSEM